MAGAPTIRHHDVAWIVSWTTLAVWLVTWLAVGLVFRTACGKSHKLAVPEESVRLFDLALECQPVLNEGVFVTTISWGIGPFTGSPGSPLFAGSAARGAPVVGHDYTPPWSVWSATGHPQEPWFLGCGRSGLLDCRETAIGFPFRAIVINSVERPNARSTRSIVGVRGLPLGILGDSVLMLSTVALSLWTIRAVTRQRRLQRGRCTRCAYDTRGVERCPECGVLVRSKGAIRSV